LCRLAPLPFFSNFFPTKFLTQKVAQLKFQAFFSVAKLLRMQYLVIKAIEFFNSSHLIIFK